jgi:hypothetical protein
VGVDIVGIIVGDEEVYDGDIVGIRVGIVDGNTVGISVGFDGV